MEILVPDLRRQVLSSCICVARRCQFRVLLWAVLAGTGYLSCLSSRRAPLGYPFPYRQTDQEAQRICFRHLHDARARSEGLCRNGRAGVPGTAADGFPVRGGCLLLLC